MSRFVSRWPAYARIPPFLPVPLRHRSDGWTAERQARFIGMLAQTGSVAAAARSVGMSRMAAYRLRRAAADGSSFAHSWDAVLALLGGSRPGEWKVTPEEMRDWAMEGPFHIVMRRGRLVSARRKPNTSMLLRCLRQANRLTGRVGPSGAGR